MRIIQGSRGGDYSHWLGKERASAITSEISGEQRKGLVSPSAKVEAQACRIQGQSWRPEPWERLLDVHTQVSRCPLALPGELGELDRT